MFNKKQITKQDYTKYTDQVVCVSDIYYWYNQITCTTMAVRVNEDRDLVYIVLCMQMLSGETVYAYVTMSYNSYIRDSMIVPKIVTDPGCLVWKRLEQRRISIDLFHSCVDSVFADIGVLHNETFSKD